VTPDPAAERIASRITGRFATYVTVTGIVNSDVQWVDGPGIDTVVTDLLEAGLIIDSQRRSGYSTITTTGPQGHTTCYLTRTLHPATLILQLLRATGPTYDDALYHGGDVTELAPASPAEEVAIALILDEGDYTSPVPIGWLPSIRNTIKTLGGTAQLFETAALATRTTGTS
jgi:hypothetical protein